MRKFSILCLLLSGIAALLMVPFQSDGESVDAMANKYKTITATACDSLIKANELNPNFVILDVRTPDVWKADHLAGSINRNYYDADFDTQLKALPKNKVFLLHCQSGGRSAPTLVKMKNLNFTEVYEMSGGINSWKSKSLPTTNFLAPKLMLVSNGGVKNGTVTYGAADTLKITITNRANDLLKFTSVTFPEGNEFSGNFDLSKKLNGSEDYTFSVYYSPLLAYREQASIVLASNGGTINLNIILKKGTVQAITPLAKSEPEIYPNPASDFVSFKNISGTALQEISVVNLNGRLVKRLVNFPATGQMNVGDLPAGLYLIRFIESNRIFTRKLMIGG